MDEYDKLLPQNINKIVNEKFVTNDSDNEIIFNNSAENIYLLSENDSSDSDKSEDVKTNIKSIYIKKDRGSFLIIDAI